MPVWSDWRGTRERNNYGKDEEGFGAVRAVDSHTGEMKWQFKMNDVTDAGVLTTATDVLFSGGREGYFYALDAPATAPCCGSSPSALQLCPVPCPIRSMGSSTWRWPQAPRSSPSHCRSCSRLLEGTEVRGSRTHRTPVPRRPTSFEGQESHRTLLTSERIIKER